MDDWPENIRPTESGDGLRIRVWRRGKLAYSETRPGDPQKPANVASAIKRRDELKARLKLGLPLYEGDDGKELFSDVAQRWLNSLQIDPDTIDKYTNILNQHWMPAYASWTCDMITRADIKERLAATKLSIKTQKNILGPLRMVLRHGDTNPNPANDWEWPSKPKGKRKKDKVRRYRPEERDAVITELDKYAMQKRILAQEKPTQKNRTDAHWAEQAALYFPLLFACGFRPGEALALEDPDYNDGLINVDKQYTRSKAKDTTKTGADRSVYVPTWVRHRLDNRTTRLRGGPILVGFRGEALKDTKRLNPIWKKAHEKARLPCRDPSTCRHTRAAELRSQGVSPAEGAAELGHSTKMFLEIYSEFIEEYAGERDYSRLEGVAPTKNRQNFRGASKTA